MLTQFTRTEFIMMLGPIVMFLIVLEMVRRRQLREDYSLLWLAVFAVMILLAFLRNTLLDVIAGFMGIFYPPAALFVIGMGLMLLVMLQFSVVITKLANQNKQAAQQIALLSSRIRDLESELDANAPEK